MRPHTKAATAEPSQGPVSRLRFYLPAFAIRAASGSTGGSGRFPLRSTLVFLLAALVLCLAVTASPASATTPAASLELLEVHPTRAFLIGNLGANGAELQWRIEYSTSASGPWTLAAHGSNENTADSEIRHLTPQTTYHARFVVETASSGDATSTTEFKTLPVGAPEFLAAPCAEGEVSFNAIGGSEPRPSMCGGPPHVTAAGFRAELDTAGAKTEYDFEYAAFETGPWTPVFGAAGSITAAEDVVRTKEAQLTGLSPGTTYFLRAFATNEKGTAAETVAFATPPAYPTVFVNPARNVTATSARLVGNIIPHSSETHWRFEYSSSQGGPWVHGPEGTISAAEAGEGSRTVVASLSGLRTGTYYVRLFAENASGEGKNGFGEAVLTETRGILSFETFGPPSASTFAVHALHGEAIRVLGSIKPNSVPTSGEQVITIEGAPTGGTFTLAFKGQTTAPIAFDASPGEVEKALEVLSTKPSITVSGSAGSSYIVFFNSPDGEVNQPQMTADASDLTPLATVSIATVLQGGEGYDTQAHFEYVSEKQFRDEGEWAKATVTPTLDLGFGANSKSVGQDIPGLQAGETYHYRIVATNTSPGNPIVEGAEQTLTAPAPAPVEPVAPCPNEEFRSGPSAELPDCRAYEQLTPVDKEGSAELFHYFDSAGLDANVLVGEDGEHVVVDDSNVSWGAGPDAGQGPYFFSRTSAGWHFTAASPEPETGINTIRNSIYSPDLSQFAFQTGFVLPGSESKEVDLKVGPPAALTPPSRPSPADR